MNLNNLVTSANRKGLIDCSSQSQGIFAVHKCGLLVWIFGSSLSFELLSLVSAFGVSIGALGGFWRFFGREGRFEIPSLDKLNCGSHWMNIFGFLDVFGWILVATQL